MKSGRERPFQNTGGENITDPECKPLRLLRWSTEFEEASDMQASFGKSWLHST